MRGEGGERSRERESERGMRRERKVKKERERGGGVNGLPFHTSVCGI